MEGQQGRAEEEGLFTLKFTQQQKDEFNGHFSALFYRSSLVTGEEMSASVMRMGTILCRMMCITALLRSLEIPSLAVPDPTINPGNLKDGIITRHNLSITDEDFRAVLDVNLTGAFHMIRACLPLFIRRRAGSIVNITSVSGMMGNPGQANYASSKAGLIGLTKSLARELAARNVTVNAVAPGFIDTDMTAVLPEAVRTGMTQGIPAGRAGQPEDVAQAVAFFAAEQSSYLTGQVLCVDGGMAM